MSARRQISCDAVPPAAGPAQGALADALLDALGAIALLLDAGGAVLRMNRAAAAFLGAAQADACAAALSWECFVPPAQRERMRAWLAAAGAGDETLAATMPGVDAQGRPRLLRWSLARLASGAPGPGPVVAIAHDVTEEQRLVRANARLASYRAFLAQVSQAMAQAISETDLVRGVCELAVRHAGVRLAWAGAPDAGGRVRIIGAAGPALDYLDGIEVSVDERVPTGQGTFGRCWREGRALFNMSFSAHPMLGYWRERAEAHGLEASAVLPLRRGRSMLAVLILYSDEPGFFDAELQELLLELVHDIEQGLDHLQLRQLNKALVDHADAGVAVVRDWHCLYANARMAQMFAYAAPGELEGMPLRDIVGDPEAWRAVHAGHDEFEHAGTLRLAALPMRRRDGERLWCDLVGVRLDAQRSVWTVLDVTARELQRQESEQLQRVYRALLAEGEVVLRARDEVQMLQQTCERLVQDTPFHAAALRRPDARGWLQTLAMAGPGSSVMNILRAHVEDSRSLAARAWREARPVLSNRSLEEHRDTPWCSDMTRHAWEAVLAVPVLRAGSVWAVLVFVAPSPDAFGAQTLETCQQVCELLGHGLDELDLKRRLRSLQSEEAHRARHDMLTALPNRFALEQYLPQAMARAARRANSLAVGLIDLDDFKLVNDSFGHAAGDLLLQQLAQRLRQRLRAGDFVARLGGDEFVVVIEDLDLGEAVLQLDIALRRLHRAVEHAFELGQQREGRIGLSMGVALYPAHGEDAGALLRRADTAMYDVKARKHQRLRWWQIAQAAPSLSAG